MLLPTDVIHVYRNGRRIEVPVSELANGADYTARIHFALMDQIHDLRLRAMSTPPPPPKKEQP
jgi:hypothetical protein